MENEEIHNDVEPTLWGILKQTLIPSSVIHKILILRGSNGQLCVVIVKETTLIINNGRPIPLPAPILGAEILKSLTEDFLLLTLKSGWLLVVRIFPNGDIPLVVTSYMMGREFSGANDLGVRIAVESEGRFFAVADCSKRVRIMAFGSERGIGLSDSPDIQSRHTITIDNGVILNMAFLTSSGGSNVNSTANSSVSSPRIDAVDSIPREQSIVMDVYLVVLYASARKLKLNMYKVPYGQKEYIHDTGLCGTFTLTLDYMEEIPLYMVPVSVNDSSAIVLVTRDQLLLVTFFDIMSGHRILTSTYLPDFPLAIHQSPFDRGRRVFYVSTEMGSLYMVRVEKKGFQIISLVELKRDLGSSFVLQPYDEELGVIENYAINESEKVLITYGGDLCMGGSIVFSLNQIISEEEGNEGDIEEIEVFDNWAPISDFKALNIHSKSKGDSLELFACTGLKDTGSVTQFRHGFRASIFSQGPSIREAPNLYSMKSEDGIDNYLVVSLPWKSTLYLVSSESEEGEDEGEDYFPQLSEVPNDCGVNCNSETKAISFLPSSRYVVQVTNSQIIVSDLSGFSLYHDIPNINSATIVDNFISISYHEENINKVCVYCIYKEEVDSIKDREREKEKEKEEESNDNNSMPTSWISLINNPLTFSHPITFIKFIKIKNEINLFIGSYEPKISIYQVEPLIFLNNEIIFENDEIPNDIYFQSDSLTYIIGLRNGMYLHCELKDKATIKSKRRLGNLPIQFIPIDNKSKTILLTNGKLSCFDNKNISDAPQTVIIDTDKIAEIKSACHFYSQIDDEEHQFIAVIMNSRLTILVLDRFATIIPKQVRLGITPKRLLYIDHICAFAVVCSPWKRANGRLLRFVDPKRMNEVNWNLDDNKQLFIPNEVIFSVCEWSLQSDGNLYKYLVLGSGIIGKSEGRIRILRLSRSSSGIRITVQNYWKTDGPVYAVAQFKNYSLIYSESSKIFIKKLQVHTNDKSFTMFTHSSIQLSSPVLKLDTTDDNIIYALTMANSISVLKLINENEANAQLILTNNDPVRRASVSQYTLNDNFILVSDKGMNFVGLQRYPDSTKLHKLFMIQLDSIISKIGPGEFKPIWVEDEDDDGDISMIEEGGVWEQPPKKRVLATGFGGAVYAFKTLNTRESAEIKSKLKALENIELERYNTPIYPGIMWRQDPRRHSNNVIDGDYILAKYKDEGWVRDLLGSTSLGG